MGTSFGVFFVVVIVTTKLEERLCVAGYTSRHFKLPEARRFTLVTDSPVGVPELSTLKDIIPGSYSRRGKGLHGIKEKRSDFSYQEPTNTINRTRIRLR